MTMKLDLYDVVESSLNDEESEEDIVAEYVESERIDTEYEERCLSGKNPMPMNESIPLVQQISDYFLDGPCCTKKCCESWKEKELIQHVGDIKYLSRNEKKLVLLTAYISHSITWILVISFSANSTRP